MTSSPALPLPTALIEETREIARVLAAPESLSAVREFLPDDRAFVCPEVARLWTHVRIVADKGLPLTEPNLSASIADDTQAALVLCDALSMAATMTGPGVAKAAVRNAQSMADALDSRENPPADDAPAQVELPPVPLDALPNGLGEFVAAVAREKETSPEMAMTCALVVASACVPSTATIRARGGWQEIGSMWAVIVAPSGDTKTPVMETFCKPLRDHDRALNREFSIAETAHLRACAELQKSKATRHDPKPKPPTHPQAVADDATLEALVDALNDNARIGQALLWVSDEFAGRVSGLNQYKGGKGSDRQTLLKLHSGSPVHVLRRGRRVYVDGPRVSLLGTIQPRVLAALAAVETGDGLFERLHFVRAGDCGAPKWNVPSVPQELRDRWEQTLRGLLPRVNASDLQPAEDGAPAGIDDVTYTLAPDAAALMGAWHEGNDKREITAFWLRGYASKLHGEMLRLALVLHHLKHGADTRNHREIDATTMQAALDVGTWLAAHTARNGGEMHGGFSGSMEARRVLSYVKKQGGLIYLRDLVTAGPSCVRTNEAAQKACAELVAAELASWIHRDVLTGRERDGIRLTGEAMQ